MNEDFKEDEARRERILRDLDIVKQTVIAIKRHVDIIKETNDREAAITSLRVIEEILPNAKAMIRQKREIFEEITDKCIKMNLV
jgi:hypothetical protein